MARNQVDIVLRAVDEASRQLEAVEKELKTLKRQVGETEREMGRMQRTWKNALGPSRALATGIAAIGTAASGAAGFMVKLAGDMEQTETAFTTLLGSAGAARQQLEDLADFASSTPFSLVGLQDASRLLLAFGFQAEQLLPMLGTIGDAISALGGGQEELQGVIRAIGQIQAKGKISAEELLQLAERGIPAYQILQEELGLTGDQVANIGTEGISAAEGIDALLRGMQERFAGAMEDQSQTLLGLWSNLMDEANRASIAIGQDLIDALNLDEAVRRAIDALTRLRQQVEDVGLTGIFEEWRAAIFAVAGAITAALIPAIVSAGIALAGAVASLAPFLAVGAAVGGLIALATSFREAKIDIEGFTEKTQEAVDAIGTPDTKESLAGKVDELAEFLSDEDKTGFKNWAEDAIRNAEDVAEAYDLVTERIIDQQVRMATAGLRSQLEAAQSQLGTFSEEEMQAVQAEMAVAQALESAYARLADAEEQGQTDRARAIADRIEELYAQQDQLLANTSQTLGGARSQQVRVLLTEIEGLERRISEAEGEIRSGLDLPPLELDTSQAESDVDRVRREAEDDPIKLKLEIDPETTGQVRSLIAPTPGVSAPDWVRAAGGRTSPGAAAGYAAFLEGRAGMQGPAHPIQRGDEALRRLQESLAGVEVMANQAAERGVMRFGDSLAAIRDEAFEAEGVYTTLLGRAVELRLAREAEVDAMDASRLANQRAAQEIWRQVEAETASEEALRRLNESYDSIGVAHDREVQQNRDRALAYMATQREAQASEEALRRLNESFASVAYEAPRARDSFLDAMTGPNGILSFIFSIPTPDTGPGPGDGGEVEEANGIVDVLLSSLQGLANQVPAVGAAIQGFMTGGPWAALIAGVSSLLGESDAFRGIMEQLGRILEPIVETFTTLLDALAPLIDVAFALIEVALAPLIAILENIVAPVFEGVARLVATIWNAIASAINATVGWLFGFALPTVDIGRDQTYRPEESGTTTRDRDTGSTSSGGRRDVNFGTTPQGVQLAVATPLVQAADMILQAAQLQLRAASQSQLASPIESFGKHVDTFGQWVDTLTTRGIPVTVSLPAGSGRPRAAALRGSA